MRARRRWPRSILPGAMLIGALGLTTTVLVAWGLAAWLPLTGAHKHFNAVRIGQGKASRWVRLIEVRKPGMVRRVWSPWTPAYSAGAFSKAYEDAATLPIDLAYRPRQDRSWGALPRDLAESNPSPQAGMDDARGWPWPALWCEVDAAAMDAAPGRRAVKGGFWVGGSDSAKCRALPLVPRWRGLVLDTGVYGAAWLGLVGGAGLVKTRVRRWRGRCTRCGYPLQAGRCTECGWGEGDAGGLTPEGPPANPEPCA